MGGIFSAPKAPPPPPPPPPPPERSSAEVAAEAAAERKRLRAQRGRASTILTGGQGVANGSAVATKQLLGQ